MITYANKSLRKFFFNLKKIVVTTYIIAQNESCILDLLL